MIFLRHLAKLAKKNKPLASSKMSNGGGLFKKIIFGLIGLTLLASVYFEYVRRSQIGSVLVWNYTGEAITLNQRKLPPSPLSVTGANRREIFSKRRDINYYTHINPTLKNYHYLYFDVDAFKRSEKTHPGFRIRFQVGIKTVALGCPSLVHDKPYSLMTIGYDNKRQRYFAVCSSIQIEPFLARFPVGSFHSARHVMVARKYFEDASKRIRVYRVTPAHAQFNTLRF